MGNFLGFVLGEITMGFELSGSVALSGMRGGGGGRGRWTVRKLRWWPSIRLGVAARAERMTSFGYANKGKDLESRRPWGFAFGWLGYSSTYAKRNGGRGGEGRST